MSLNIGKIVEELRGMTVRQLQDKYLEVHGEPTRAHHREHLIRRIAWRLQAMEEGDLPERARRRALAIANDADLRLRAPTNGNGTSRAVSSRANTRQLDVPADARLPMPGTLLTRQYRGRTIQVRVLPNGFDYEGVEYRSLSAVAKAVTGSHWNGYLFFGLEPSEKKEVVHS